MNFDLATSPLIKDDSYLYSTCYELENNARVQYFLSLTTSIVPYHTANGIKGVMGHMSRTDIPDIADLSKGGER
ncbi:hypothetical protein WA026_002209 [Henosepilachna vigintioctopunctata]|uniref:Uncharacterized protein n=1 Tax=Henosepilachna vigintioctopunctata TaxID=420089 RepID=A0AAW1TQP8_9CUCU